MPLWAEGNNYLTWYVSQITEYTQGSIILFLSLNIVAFDHSFYFSVLQKLLPFQEDLGLKEDTYELAYNKTCYLVAREDYKTAIQKLDKADGTFYI